MGKNKKNGKNTDKNNDNGAYRHAAVVCLGRPNRLL